MLVTILLNFIFQLRNMLEHLDKLGRSQTKKKKTSDDNHNQRYHNGLANKTRKWAGQSLQLVAHSSNGWCCWPWNCFGDGRQRQSRVTHGRIAGGSCWLDSTETLVTVSLRPLSFFFEILFLSVYSRRPLNWINMQMKLLLVLASKPAKQHCVHLSIDCCCCCGE